MASLKDIRIRIASVKSTRKITSAMKVVSAAKFHKAQEQQVRFQKYQSKFSSTLGLAIEHCEEYNHPLLESPEQGKGRVLLLAFSSNSSLCGAYNINVINEAKRQLASLIAEGKHPTVHCFGKEMHEGLKGDIEVSYHDESLVGRPTFDKVSSLYDRVQKAFLDGEYEKVLVVYNRFRNAAQQESTVKQLLPVAAEFSQLDSKEDERQTEYIIEPSPKAFFDFALPHFGKLSLYSYVLNNYVGEHGARMTAMSQATDNANSLVSDLTLEYNKARQAAITNEILEIVSGANALKNG